MLRGICSRRSGLALAAGVGAFTLAVSIVGCGGSNAGGSNSPKARPTVVSSPTPNVAKISNELLAASNQMITADNSKLANYNSQDSATASTGINATNQDQQTFDAALRDINLPAADSANVTAVLNADAAFEKALALSR